MLSQQALHNAKDTKKIESNAALLNISNKVMQVCCFGSQNIGKPHELTQIFDRLMIEVCKVRDSVVNLGTIEGADIPVAVKLQVKESADFLKQNFQKYFGFSLDAWDKYFVIKSEDDKKQNALINPSVLPAILRSFGELIQRQEEDAKKLGYSQIMEDLKTHDVEHYYPFICFLTYHWVTEVKCPEKLTAERKKELEIGTKYSLTKLMEPNSKEERLFFIKYLIKDLIKGAFNFGTGNCQVMAELAFFIAIQNLNNTPIRYVQFHGSKYEELNGIIVGHYPKPGCTVLAPWYSDEPFEWQGTLDKTPEIKHYKKVSTMFTVKDQKEQEYWRGVLKELNFDLEKLLGPENVNRTNYLKFIKDKSAELFSICQAAAPKRGLAPE